MKTLQRGIRVRLNTTQFLIQSVQFHLILWILIIQVGFMRKVVDIESSGGNIGCNEQLQIAKPELLHDSVALLLRKVAVQRVGIVSAVA